MAALAVALLVAGCGGSDSDAESIDTNLTTSSLSKAQFIKQADAICYRGKEQQLAQVQVYLREHKNLPRSNPGVEAVQTILVPSVEDQLAELRELGAPAGEANKIEAMWNGLERSIKLIDEEGISASAALRRAYLPNGQRIFAYGVRGCAYGR